MVVPPVNRHLLPAANFKPLIQDARAQGRREALCSRCHMSHVILGLRCPPSPLGAWEVLLEPQPDRSIALSAQAAAAVAAEGRLVGRSCPERALQQRGGGEAPLHRGPLLVLARSLGTHAHPRMLRRWQLHRVAAPPGEDAACGVSSDPFTSRAVPLDACPGQRDDRAAAWKCSLSSGAHHAGALPSPSVPQSTQSARAHRPCGSGPAAPNKACAAPLAISASGVGETSAATCCAGELGSPSSSSSSAAPARPSSSSRSGTRRHTTVRIG